uniref:Ig-like domain-containing protein n=2 Tax=Poecilia formosa TaxID=48698 RepID=A0A096M497_POEFO
LSDRNVTDPKYEGRITLFRSTGSLELRDLKLSDSGVYTVIIITANGIQMTGNTRLQIYETVSVEVNPSNANVVEFSSFSFFCSSSGSDLSFLWFNGSSEITPSDRVQINTTNGGSFLTIVNVTRYDLGTYWCHVSSFVSSNNDSASLVVNYGPEETQLEVLPSQDYYDEGSTVTLMCSAVSLPPAEFSWLKDEVALPDTGPELTFSKIQMSHDGSYTCFALNSETLRHQTSQPLIINVKKNPDSSGLSAGAIAGIVIACLVVVAAA